MLSSSNTFTRSETTRQDNNVWRRRSLRPPRLGLPQPPGPMPGSVLGLVLVMAALLGDSRTRLPLGRSSSTFWGVQAWTFQSLSRSESLGLRVVAHRNHQGPRSPARPSPSPADYLTAARSEKETAALAHHASFLCTRSAWLQRGLKGGVVSSLTWMARASAGDAVTEASSPTVSSRSTAFAAVRREVTDPDGGVAYMQTCLETQEWDQLMEFTKSYDLVLRKELMGRARKQLTDPAARDRATAASNAVTFDLIGINRYSRPQQRDAAQVLKYLQELRDDVQLFLALESSS